MRAPGRVPGTGDANGRHAMIDVTLVSVFLVGLLGGLHCAGMCGGIAAFCGGVGECSAKRSMGASAVYHASRLASYALSLIHISEPTRPN